MSILSIQAQGAVYTVILFAICAILVHAVRLAAIGYKSMKKRSSAVKKATPETEKTAEPVYYIVERKKKRPKSEYSDPRRIQFK